MGAAEPNNDPRPYSFILPTNSMLDVEDSTVIKPKSHSSRNLLSFGEELQYKETEYYGVQWELVEGVTTPYWGSRDKNTSLEEL